MHRRTFITPICAACAAIITRTANQTKQQEICLIKFVWILGYSNRVNSCARLPCLEVHCVSGFPSTHLTRIKDDSSSYDWNNKSQRILCAEYVLRQQFPQDIRRLVLFINWRSVAYMEMDYRRASVDLTSAAVTPFEVQLSSGREYFLWSKTTGFKLSITSRNCLLALGMMRLGKKI
ncbi:hypothetical protein Mp_8g17630 [Marchantia polymorpha subsp. ruderalis]|uniref:Uncharacterized protein n=1 Tax=Marchantia polymorpha TaxID=3197 RepID=A0A2R6X8D4_MARPO|nr:hypothetical protein MARPO_0030s0098 [Marchantia polymorpha]BBN20245.1 hypothetical protein Mp_8g17630 [Marchantia polymorpha subsp. ruderalis]|eukprot:PTQ42365.1 hypothetical protein MARPO_0030s0098 [Marchantia polymorpha]